MVGLKGGKGVFEIVMGYLVVFFMLIVLSFGLVYMMGLGGCCCPCCEQLVCLYGVLLLCAVCYGEGDLCFGELLCLDCWDYYGVVIWNNTFGALWCYIMIYIFRVLVCEW